jgi:hypothetical protein
MPNINRLSRYYDGKLAQIYNSKTKQYDIAVFKAESDEVTSSYINYTWKYGDSLAALSDKYLGIPGYWWKIMEINPEITDPFSIEPGTVIRVPYVTR